MADEQQEQAPVEDDRSDAEKELGVSPPTQVVPGPSNAGKELGDPDINTAEVAAEPVRQAEADMLAAHEVERERYRPDKPQTESERPHMPNEATETGSDPPDRP